jgi:hypothetical protein
MRSQTGNCEEYIDQYMVPNVMVDISVFVISEKYIR